MALTLKQARRSASVWAVARAIDAVRRTDAGAERARQDRLAARLEGCRAIVARLQTEGSLPLALERSVAADLLWTITSLRTWEDLVLARGWSARQYQERITRLLRQMLTCPGYADSTAVLLLASCRATADETPH